VSLSVSVSQPGKALDFSLTSFGVPVTKTKLAQAITTIAGNDLQVVPLNIENHGTGFVLVQCTSVIACLDEVRSEWLKWTKADHRADLAGQYRMVSRLHVKTTSIPKGVQFFRIDGWSVALVVSETVRRVMEVTGCVGAKFEEVT
jgi:hypothetical protein